MKFTPESTIDYEPMLHLVVFTILLFSSYFVPYQTSCQQHTTSTRERWLIVVYLVMNCSLLVLWQCQTRLLIDQAPCWALEEYSTIFSSLVSFKLFLFS